MAATSAYQTVPLDPPSEPEKAATRQDGSSEKESLTKEEEEESPTPGPYKPTKAELEADPLERLQQQDRELKRQIRIIKIVSRSVAAVLSLAVLVPLSITLHKFLTTQNTYRTVTNESLAGQPVTRTAWARQTKTWPHTMYFTIAVLSLAFNVTIMFSYLRSVKAANRAAAVGTVFNAAVFILHVVIWVVTAALYKRESVVTTNGVHEDLWGWTCSPAAKLLQPVFEEQIDFDRYCDIQASSWYIGLVQIGAMSLTMVVYFMAMRRLQSKKNVRRSMTARGMTG